MAVTKSEIIKAIEKGNYKSSYEIWGVSFDLDETRGYYDENGYDYDEEEEEEYTDFYPFVYYIAETDIKSGPAEIDFRVEVCGLTFTRHADAGVDPMDWDCDDNELEIDDELEDALNSIIPSYDSTMDNLDYFRLAYPKKEDVAKVVENYSDYDFFEVEDYESETDGISVYAREKVDEQIPEEFEPISKERAIELLYKGCLKSGNI